MEHGIQWLLEKREADPYKNFAQRLLFEMAPGLQKQRKAPTFKIEGCRLEGP